MPERLDALVFSLDSISARIVEWNAKTIADLITSRGWQLNRVRNIYEREVVLYFTDTGWVCDADDPQVAYKCNLKLGGSDKVAVFQVGGLDLQVLSGDNSGATKINKMIRLSISMSIQDFHDFKRLITNK